MNKKQQKTLDRVFKIPTRSDIEWKDIKSLLTACNADDKVFHGRVLGITDVIGFEGASVTELEKRLSRSDR